MAGISTGVKTPLKIHKTVGTEGGPVPSETQFEYHTRRQTRFARGPRSPIKEGSSCYRPHHPLEKRNKPNLLENRSSLPSRVLFTRPRLPPFFSTVEREMIHSAVGRPTGQGLENTPAIFLRRLDSLIHQQWEISIVECLPISYSSFSSIIDPSLSLKINVLRLINVVVFYRIIYVNENIGTLLLHVFI